MTTKKVFIWILASLCTLIISSCNNNSKIDRDKLSQALAKYDSFSDFSNGFARVQKDKKYGVIDKSGSEVAPCEYDGIFKWTEARDQITGKQAILLPNGKMKELVGYKYILGVQNTDEIMAVGKGGEDGFGRDGKWGFIDKTGKEIIPCIYDLPSDDHGINCSFSEGLINVGTYNKYGFIDKTGKEVIPLTLRYSFIGDFSDGMAFVSDFFISGEEAGKYGFIDKTGREVIPRVYENASPFSEGLACVQRNGKYGFIDKNGKEAIPFNYNMTSEGDDVKESTGFYKGLAVMRVNDGSGSAYSWDAEGKCGVIDKTGKVIIPFTYSNIAPFENGFIYSNFDPKNGGDKFHNQKWGLLDKTGKEITPCIYDNMPIYSEGLASVSKNDKYGFIDKTGKEVIPLIYDEIYAPEGIYTSGKSTYFPEGLAGVKKKGKWGFIDKTGKEVIPCVLEEITDYSGIKFSDGLALVKWNNQVGYVDKEGYFIGKEIVKNLNE